MIVGKVYRRHFRALASLFFVVLINYALTLKGGFLVDDFSFLDGRYDYDFVSWKDFFCFNASQHFSPFYYIWYTFLYKFITSTFALHAINIILFAVACWACYTFLTVLLGEPKKAFYATLLFALHPMHSLPVIDIAQNYFSLFLILMFCSAYFFKRSLDEDKKIFFVFSCVLFALALFTFEAAILTPAYLFIYAYFFQRKPFVFSLKKVILPGLLSVSYLVLWVVMASRYSGLVRIHHLNLTLWSYLQQVFVLMAWHIRNLFFPYDMVHIFNFNSFVPAALFPLGLFGVVFLMGSITLIVYLKDRNITGAFLWFLTSFLIVLPATFAHSYMGLILEPHWMIFGSAGFCVFLVLVFERVSTIIPLFLKRFIVLVVLVNLFASTQFLNARSLSRKDYFQFWAGIAPHNPIPIINLGHMAMNDADYETAKPYFHRVIAVGGYQGQAAFFNLGVMSWKENDIESAKNYFYQAADIGPASDKIFNFLGVIAMRQGRIDEAADFFKKAVSLNKKYFNGAYNIGHIYMLKKKYNEAYQHYQGQFKNFKIRAEHRKLTLARLIVLSLILQRDSDLRQWLQEWSEENPTKADTAQLNQLIKDFGIEGLLRGKKKVSDLAPQDHIKENTDDD